MRKTGVLLYLCAALCYTFFMEKIIVATSNAGKLKEIKEILGDGYEVLSMGQMGFTDDVEETGATFYENALIKAKTVSEALNLPALADDSGLEVDALGGAPGIFSARYSGEPCDNARNRALLLKNMQGVTDRKANFTCCMVMYKPSGEIVTAEGKTYGSILAAECGDNGFGYDSLFFSDDLQKSFGMATEDEKNSVSHRARALHALIEKLK